MIYINVPYSDRKKIKLLGGKWDKKEKKWYIDDDNPIKEEYKEYKDISNIEGEDRNFGGNELFIDMIPKTSYFKNIRTIFSKDDWNIIRHYIYKRVNYRCECCGCYRNKFLEAHERWSYDFENKIQKLERIIALCRLCHLSTHYGFSKNKKNFYKINEHLKKVKKINDEELENHIKQSYDLWKERNKIKWIIDYSIISNSGFNLIPIDGE